MHQCLKRWLGLQTEEERKEELVWIEQREIWKHISKIFGMNWWWNLKSWFEFDFLHAIGLHKSLIESIREGFGPAPRCSRCGGALTCMGIEYGATSEEDYLEWECPECDRETSYKISYYNDFGHATEM